MKRRFSLFLLIIFSLIFGRVNPLLARRSVPAEKRGSHIDTQEIAKEHGAGWWRRLPKEEKMMCSTATAAAIIGLWGFATWDYASSGFHTTNEGWFAEDTKYGGADKLGHFWTTYVLSDALTGIYTTWGYQPRRANAYGALSAWVVQSAMELGDGSSKTQGFSWEDMVVNTVGALTSIAMEQYPSLDRKIDFRVSYLLNVKMDGIFDDYSNQLYSLVLKLDGFESMNDTLLSYLEVHVGYFTRGYDSSEVAKSRSFFAGVTVNLSKIFREHGYAKTGKVLEYFQLPYTLPYFSYDID